VYPLSDEQSDEQQEDMDYSQPSVSTPEVTYGPHQKFSRGMMCML
jgi:hypothetical protein